MDGPIGCVVLDDLLVCMAPGQSGRPDAPSTTLACEMNTSEGALKVCDSQKLRLDLHGDPCMALRGWTVKLRQRQFCFSTDQARFQNRGLSHQR